MADRFLTISEAEKFTGKSRSTLRRLIDAIVKVEKSPDRHLVEPGTDEVTSLRRQNQPFAWRISEELLRRHFLKAEAGHSDTAGTPAAGEEGSAKQLIALLQKTVTVLERELAEKNTQIAAMNERQRESNILLKDAQQRLALPQGNVSSSVETQKPPRAAEGTATTAKKKAAPKRRRFGWLFRS